MQILILLESSDGPDRWFAESTGKSRDIIGNSELSDFGAKKQVRGKGESFQSRSGEIGNLIFLGEIYGDLAHNFGCVMTEQGDILAWTCCESESFKVGTKDANFGFGLRGTTQLLEKVEEELGPGLVFQRN